jgi:hypothetical protein
MCVRSPHRRRDAQLDQDPTSQLGALLALGRTDLYGAYSWDLGEGQVAGEVAGPSGGCPTVSSWRATDWTWPARPGQALSA